MRGARWKGRDGKDGHTWLVAPAPHAALPFDKTCMVAPACRLARRALRDEPMVERKGRRRAPCGGRG
eukprot:356382-Chlamydomonas_euryale.AAC.4